MNYHFIAIGGSAMHNLAMALHHKGETISGSDDEIFEPSRSRLNKFGLLPESEGWYPEKIHQGIDAVVLGMHAKKDNPELLKAQELGVKIFSYPEFLYEQTKTKKRIVIGGSHGKTSTTAMILHVLQAKNIAFDYMVGAQLDGFDTMVGFSDEAEIAVFEGDEYLTSPIDPRPKFHLYKPHIALITGIAWDHINVFPTFDNYVDQFKQFIQLVEPKGTLIYYKGDEELLKLAKNIPEGIVDKSYDTFENRQENGITSLIREGDVFPIQIFGDHNLQNLSGAQLVCEELGISPLEFIEAIASFKGASKRLQLLAETDNSLAYLDFAHSPSKLKATVEAVKKQYPTKTLIACMELHTYSSLNKEFLKEYDGAMEMADKAFVYYSEHAIQLKRLENLEKNDIAESFNKQGLEVFDKQKDLIKALNFMEYNNTVLLLLSSGNFSGIKLEEYASELLKGGH